MNSIELQQQQQRPFRPQTSKPRGICKYYTTPRGCFAGDLCKFLHSDEPLPSSSTSGSANGKDVDADETVEDGSQLQPRLTPYDRAKKCVFYARGYCKRGESCWFKHELATAASESVAAAEESETCGICLEIPTTFGLLEGCSHVFCVSCIRQWRSRKADDYSDIDSSMQKKCPLCRQPSRFIIPSSIFHPSAPASAASSSSSQPSASTSASPSPPLLPPPPPPEDPKTRVINSYKASMKRIPCKHFVASKGRSCRFGNECFYQHVDKDGNEVRLDAPHARRHGVEHIGGLSLPFIPDSLGLGTEATWRDQLLNIFLDYERDRRDIVAIAAAAEGDAARIAVENERSEEQFRRDLEAVFDALGLGTRPGLGAWDSASDAEEEEEDEDEVEIGGGGFEIEDEEEEEEEEEGEAQEGGERPEEEEAMIGDFMNYFFELVPVQDQYGDIYPNTPTLVAGIDEENMIQDSEDVVIGGLDSDDEEVPIILSSSVGLEPTSSDGEGDQPSEQGTESPFVTDGRGRVVWSRGSARSSSDSSACF